jgi:hypothetical protein
MLKALQVFTGRLRRNSNARGVSKSRGFTDSVRRVREARVRAPASRAFTFNNPRAAQVIHAPSLFHFEIGRNNAREHSRSRSAAATKVNVTGQFEARSSE